MRSLDMILLPVLATFPISVTPRLRIAPFAREGTLSFSIPKLSGFIGRGWGSRYRRIQLGRSLLCAGLQRTPLAQEYLRDTIGYLLDAGIRYIKTDFINAAAIEGVRFDPESKP